MAVIEISSSDITVSATDAETPSAKAAGEPPRATVAAKIVLKSALYLMLAKLPTKIKRRNH